LPISLIRIENFRNLASIEFKPNTSGLNIICGNNGSGKTSFLEAIYYLSHGRSFRSSNSSQLIQRNFDRFSVYSQLLNNDSREIPIGVERQRTGSSKLRMAEREVSSIIEMAQLLPLRVINAHSHMLLESGPAFRRKYLDWGLFYECEDFLTSWRHYERALKQRNRVLKLKRPRNELNIWTEELIKHGLVLDRLRREYINRLNPLILSHIRQLLSIADLDLSYQAGWDESMDFATALDAGFHDEMRLGTTQNGPHRADFDVLIDGISARHFLSRGQQKLLICAMILAQGVSLSEHANKTLIYLIDDLPAELDLVSRQKLVTLLTSQQTQIFITSIESEAICNCVSDQSAVSIDVFHVEHGCASKKRLNL